MGLALHCHEEPNKKRWTMEEDGDLRRRMEVYKEP